MDAFSSTSVRASALNNMDTTDQKKKDEMHEFKKEEIL